MKVWIVRIAQGSYDDYRTWIEGVFDSELKAEIVGEGLLREVLDEVYDDHYNHYTRIVKSTIELLERKPDTFVFKTEEERHDFIYGGHEDMEDPHLIITEWEVQ